MQAFEPAYLLSACFIEVAGKRFEVIQTVLLHLLRHTDLLVHCLMLPPADESTEGYLNANADDEVSSAKQ